MSVLGGSVAPSDSRLGNSPGRGLRGTPGLGVRWRGRWLVLISRGVGACIEEAGLPVEALQGVVGADTRVEETLRVTLSGNKEEGQPNAIVITFFESEEAAA